MYLFIYLLFIIYLFKQTIWKLIIVNEWKKAIECPKSDEAYS